MAKRFINADELELEYYDLSIHGTMAVKSVLPVFVDLLEKQSTVDVAEVRHGEWKYIKMDNFRQYKVICPFCEAEYVGNYDAYIEPEDFNYCPNCGARMDGDEDD